MEGKGKKLIHSSRSSSLHYEASLGYSIEDVRPNGGIEKFQSAAYSNVTPSISNSLNLNPTEFSVAVTCKASAEGWAMWNADVEGYWCENVVKQELPGNGCIVYRTYYSTKDRVSSVRTAKKATAKCCKNMEMEMLSEKPMVNYR